MAESSTVDSYGVFAPIQGHHKSAASSSSLVQDEPKSSDQQTTITITSLGQSYGLASNPPEDNQIAPQIGSSTKDILQVTGRSILTLTKRLPEIVDGNPVKMVLSFLKLIVEIQEAVADNMDALKRRLSSTRAQLETVEKELGDWTPKTAQEGQFIQRFKLALEEALDKLNELSGEWLVRKVADYEDEKSRIMEIFDRVNEARVQFELAIGIRVFKSVYDMEKGLRKLLFDRLEPSKIADHKYHLEGREERRLHRGVCTPGTCVRILDGIVAWTKNTSPDSPTLYWLLGQAGSGKSTIAYTVARRFEFAGDPNDKITLGGNFFCSRQFEETRLSKRIIRTVVHHLALKCRPFADKLSDGDLDTVNQNVRAQLEALLVAPWQASKPARCQDPSKPLSDYLVIIDALDEIDETGGSEFLRNLLEVIEKNKNCLQGLKFFLTSRPAPNLLRHLNSLKAKEGYCLELVTPEEVHSDTRTYLSAGLPHFAGCDEIKSLVVWAAMNPVPLLRAYGGGATDHFYTTDDAELQNAVAKLGYTDEGVTGYIFSEQQPQTVPLHRLYSAGAADHFYTTSAAECDNAAKNLGYATEGTTGYVYPDASCGGLPLYRLYTGSAANHFYTMSASERDNASKNLGYTEEGIVGYIFPF